MPEHEDESSKVTVNETSAYEWDAALKRFKKGGGPVSNLCSVLTSSNFRTVYEMNSAVQSEPWSLWRAGILKL